MQSKAVMEPTTLQTMVDRYPVSSGVTVYKWDLNRLGVGTCEPDHRFWLIFLCKYIAAWSVNILAKENRVYEHNVHLLFSPDYIIQWSSDPPTGTIPCHHPTIFAYFNWFCVLHCCGWNVNPFPFYSKIPDLPSYCCHVLIAYISDMATEIIEKNNFSSVTKMKETCWAQYQTKQPASI